MEQAMLSSCSDKVLRDATALLDDASGLLGLERGPSFLDVLKERGVSDAGEYADRNFVLGQCNPLAPPMDLMAEGDSIVGRVRLGYLYEGAPEIVHGGMISALFDQLFGSEPG